MKKLVIVTSEYFHPLRYRLHHILPFLLEKFDVKIIAIAPPLYDTLSEVRRSRAATIKFLITKVLICFPRKSIQEQNDILIIRNLFPDSRLDFVLQVVNAVYAAWIMKLRKVHQGFDVCLASHCFAGFSALLAKMPIPVVYEDVDRFEFFTSSRFMKKTLGFFERYSIRNSAKVISAGFNLAKSAESIRGQKVYCIPNSIDLELFEDRYSVDADRFAIVYLGSIAPWSGLELAIKSLRVVTSDFAEAKLIVVGTGDPEYIRKLKSLAEEFDLSDKVIFLGKRNYQEIPLIISKCGIGLALFPNIDLMRYAFSFKVVEYMAAGLPVIATDVGDTGKIIKESNCGVIVETTPESVAEGIRRLFRNRDNMLILGKNGRQWSKDFDLKVLAEREIKVLSQFSNS